MNDSIESLELLSGLPSGGETVHVFPSAWTARGSEGVVVRVVTAARSWVGNFMPGAVGVTGCWKLGEEAGVVVAQGDVWHVSAISGSGAKLLAGATKVHEIGGSGLLLEIDGIRLARMSESGILWESRRLSWDGLREVVVKGGCISGSGWSMPRDTWVAFAVDLGDGASSGGGYDA